MKPIIFPESNVTFAEDQPEYLQLPAWRDNEEQGTVISCWTMTWKERLKVLVTGKVWLSTMTFRKPPQPVLLGVDYPFEPIPEEKDDKDEFWPLSWWRPF